MQNHPIRVGFVVFSLGWLFDYLFAGKVLGISFPIYIVLLITGGIYMIRLEGQRLNQRSAVLLFSIVFFSIFSFLRLEPLSRFLAILLTLFLMGLLSLSAIGGHWFRFGILDYVVKPVGLLISMVTGGAGLMAAARGNERLQLERRKLGPALRGVLLSLPVLVVFLTLLASADLIFAQQLRAIVDVFDIERIIEYGFRAFLILIVTYSLVGIYQHAARKSTESSIRDGVHDTDHPPQELVGLRLGYIEALIILGSVTLLFAVFVAFQFRYLFSGQANISLDGFTYAEYARRGFAELVMVACLTLILFIGLSIIARRESRRQRRVFSGVGIALTLLVGLILASAFQRLLMYEAAYGFSRMRTYPHVFMIWLGILLAAVVVLEAVGRQRVFIGAALLAAIGFAASLNLLNVDAFVARQNVLRVLQGHNLDVAYLVSLSDDAVPELVQLYQLDSLPEKARDATGAVLKCIENKTTSGSIQDKNQREVHPNLKWQSFHWSPWQKELWFTGFSGESNGYEVQNETLDDWDIRVKTPLGHIYPCSMYNPFVD